MSDFFDTDEAVKECRSHGLAILVGLSQSEELLSDPEDEVKMADGLEVIETAADKADILLTRLNDIIDAINNGTATTPTADSLEEEDTDE